jgi:hypothetical protein
MKAREKRVERLVAAYISEHILEPHGLEPTKRIPVLGRTGPDMTVWPHFGVAVDVKSRKAISQRYRVRAGEVIQFGDHHIGVRLGDFEELFGAGIIRGYEPTKMVADWLEHMEEWCRWPGRSGSHFISAIVLHWPRTYIKNTTFVIKISDRSILHDRYSSINHS